MNTILLACVHYHDEGQVRAFLDHVLSRDLPPGWRLEVAVGDNSGTWSDAEDVPAEVRVVPVEENVGYFGGCVTAFEGWRHARAGMPDWLGVVNTDLVITPDFFTGLLSRTFDPDVGVVAPNIVLPNGARQNPFMRSRPPRLGLRGYAQVWRIPWLSRIWDLGFEIKRGVDGSWARLAPLPASPETIYAPHGSAVFLRRRLLERVGLPFRGFMYFEEMHVAELARRAGLRVLWVPDLLVNHDEHSTTASVDPARRWRWKHQSARVVLEDYFR